MLSPAALLAEESPAAGAPWWWQLAGTVGVALLAALVGLYTARATLRSSREANRAARERAGQERDAELDRRVDAAVLAAWQRIEELTAIVDNLRDEAAAGHERYLRLRLAVIGRGLDPDELVPPAHGPPPAR